MCTGTVISGIEVSKISSVGSFFHLASTVLIGPWSSLTELSIHKHLVGLLGWGISSTQSVGS
jgi:hypothetical protein